MKNGNFVTYYPNGNPIRKDHYKNDLFKKWKMFYLRWYDTSYFEYFTMPAFKGGLEGLKKYIAEKLVFPDTAKINHEEGMVKVKFTIDKLGNVIDINLVEKDKEYFNKEAIRVVKELPRWMPGKRDGKEVDVTVTVPILFKLK
ncbi:MAG: energy transducer TonB [Bacteroidales bacterium]|nr:energy transducer TonB [Bacteroidales bacterium]